MARKETHISEDGKVSAASVEELAAAEVAAAETAAEAKNLGGRPRKVRASMTPVEFEEFSNLLRGFVAAMPVEVPEDLPEDLPEQYRTIILEKVNSERISASAAVEAAIARFA